MSDTARDAFEFLANMHSALLGFVADTQRKRNVLEVNYAIEALNFIPSGTEVSFWSEAKLKDGRVVTLWIDLEPNEGRWLVDGRISWFGSDIIYRAESKAFDSFDEAQAAVRALLDDLSARVTHIVTQELSQE